MRRPTPRRWPPNGTTSCARLNPRKRLVLLLCYHEGMRHEQAAQILGIPTGTLKSRLNAALGELRRALPAEVTS